ncbi:MAG: hypothetical protein AAF723_08285, partial [Pseudomonadota bacterium]
GDGIALEEADRNINDSHLTKMINGRLPEGMKIDRSRIQRIRAEGKATEETLECIAKAFGIPPKTMWFINENIEVFKIELQKIPVPPLKTKEGLPLNQNQETELVLRPLTPDPKRRRGAKITLDRLGQGMELHGVLTVEAVIRRYQKWLYGYRKMFIRIHFETGKEIRLEPPEGKVFNQWLTNPQLPVEVKVSSSQQEPEIMLRVKDERTALCGVPLDQHEIGEVCHVQAGDRFSIHVVANRYDAQVGTALADEDNGLLTGGTPDEKANQELMAAMLASEDRKDSDLPLDDEGGEIILAQIDVEIKEVPRNQS